MKIPTFLYPVTLITLAAAARADIFVMKDGTTLEGRILKENADTYDLEVMITKSIRDEKTVAKKDVVEIQAEKPGEKAFEKLKGLVPTPDLLQTAEYDKRIAALSAFVKEFPSSPHAATAQSMISTLKEEAAVVIGGGFKLNGKMVPASEYKADAYDIDARRLESYIRSVAAQQSYFAALRGFARMEKDFAATASRKALVPLKATVLKGYEAQLIEQLDAWPARNAERETGLSRMSGADRVRAEGAIAEERAAIEKARIAETAAEQKWMTIDPYEKQSLVAALDEIRLEVADNFEIDRPDGGAIYRKVLKAIQNAEDESAIRDAYFEAADVGMPDKYLGFLRAAAKEKGTTL